MNAPKRAVADSQTHTPLCKHATGEPEAYAARAVERGVDELGFSDHSPMPPDYDPDWRMSYEQYGAYVAMVERCRGFVARRVARVE